MSKTYKVKEIFYTLQGEGAHSGRPAVFCRFSRCNLWNGRESDRANAICNFCDTDILGTDGVNGGEYQSAPMLADRIRSLWPNIKNGGKPFVVCTGGEPALQLDEKLVEELHSRGFEVAIETNGTGLVEGEARSLGLQTQFIGCRAAVHEGQGELALVELGVLLAVDVLHGLELALDGAGVPTRQLGILSYIHGWHGVPPYGCKTPHAAHIIAENAAISRYVSNVQVSTLYVADPKASSVGL